MPDHGYRLYLLNPAGNVASRIELEGCAGDPEALARAQDVGVGRSMELWDRARFIRRMSGPDAAEAPAPDLVVDR